MFDIYSILIGDVISPATGLQIANQLGMQHIVERIESEPERYADFRFDGVSGAPDWMAALFFGVDETDLTYKVAIPHDWRFAYGQPGNAKEESMANKEFCDNLVKVGVKEWKVRVALELVKTLGSEKLPFNFCWAFASKKKESWFS